MRHRVRGRGLSVDSEHRTAMRRNLVTSLFLHGGIKTTVARAKEVRPMAEKIITLARKVRKLSGENPAEAIFLRRRVESLLGWHHTTLKVRADRKRFGDEPRTEHDGLMKKLFGEIAEQFADRAGGYTRILKLAERRLGDAGEQARLELLPKEPERKGAAVSRVKRARHRRAEGLEALKKKREQRRSDETARKASRDQAKAQAAAAAAAAPAEAPATPAPATETKAEGTPPASDKS